MKETTLKKLLIAVILIFAALVSMLFIADKASAAETHAQTAASIDEKVDTVLRLTATSTLASAGISAIPGDTATPIAEKLADFTEYFVLILCVLYAEKYLVAIIGLGTFKILIPIACLLLIVAMFWNPKLMKRLAMKLAVFGLVLFITIPASIKVSDMIYEAYKANIDDTINITEEFTDETEALTRTEDESVIASILDRISETASGLADKAAGILNRFVETLAVMIVTSCIIPILVLVFFVWLIKVFTGVQIQLPTPRGRKEHAHSTASDGE